MTKIKMKTMFESGIHFGHRTRFWHPKMEPYIYGAHNGIHIINLEKTLLMFNDALNFISKSVASNKNILFVGTKRPASNTIKEEAIRCGMPYVNYRWLGGMMTNYKTIKESIKRLKDLEYLAEENFNHVSKKEGLMMRREMNKLEKSLGGIKDLNTTPDILFIIDIGHEKIALKEARKLNIPVVAVVDTNYNPENIDYIIPGNDDSIGAISFYVREVTNTILETKATMLAGQTKEKAVEVKKTTVIEKPPTNKGETSTIASKKTPTIKYKETSTIASKKPPTVTDKEQKPASVATKTSTASNKKS